MCPSDHTHFTSEMGVSKQAVCERRRGSSGNAADSTLQPLAPAAGADGAADVTGPEEAAIKSCFASRRGTRVLIPSLQKELSDYFVSKGTTLMELPTARPADAAKVI